jgi:arabinose-5-phosphate isomerase
MDFATHQLPKRCVHQLMALQRAFALELRRNDNGLEVRVVVRSHLDLGTGHSGFDKGSDLSLIHDFAIDSCRLGRGRILAHRAHEQRTHNGSRAADRRGIMRVLMKPELNADNLIARGKRVLRVEADAIRALETRIDRAFVAACQLMQNCAGRVVVTGMGKSGHIGDKIAATLASTGTPAFFLHAAEASHGDVGMITAADVVMALSNSGETTELIAILPVLKRLGVGLIALTGRPQSTLARAADVTLDVSVVLEACPLNLAPTASTTATLAMGDALAVALLEARGFTEEDFARSHPGGTLGRRLLLHVDDVMRTGDQLPIVAVDTSLHDGLVEMSRKGLGMTTVLNAQRHLIGVFTDGDLRRILGQPIDLTTATMGTLMNRTPRSIRPRMLAAEAVHVMETHRITALPVVDEAGLLIGALNVHDLLRAGVM